MGRFDFENKVPANVPLFESQRTKVVRGAVLISFGLMLLLVMGRAAWVYDQTEFGDIRFMKQCGMYIKHKAIGDRCYTWTKYGNEYYIWDGKEWKKSAWWRLR